MPWLEMAEAFYLGLFLVSGVRSLSPNFGEDERAGKEVRDFRE